MRPQLSIREFRRVAPHNTNCLLFFHEVLQFPRWCGRDWPEDTIPTAEFRGDKATQWPFVRRENEEVAVS